MRAAYTKSTIRALNPKISISNYINWKLIINTHRKRTFKCLDLDFGNGQQLKFK